MLKRSFMYGRIVVSVAVRLWGLFLLRFISMVQTPFRGRPQWVFFFLRKGGLSVWALTGDVFSSFFEKESLWKSFRWKFKNSDNASQSFSVTEKIMWNVFWLFFRRGKGFLLLILLRWKGLEIYINFIYKIVLW